MESYPNDKKPACPVEAAEDKDAAKNLENPGNVDDPMPFELGNALSCSYITEWQQACKQCDAAERYENPTDDRD